MPSEPGHVYRKTLLGHEEMKTRAMRLDGRLRALLLMVNGERSQEALLAQLAGTGLGLDSIDLLLGAGLIEAVGISPTPSAHGNQPQAASPSASASVPDTAPNTAVSYQALYRFFTHCISTHLGLRGYLLEVKVEKAGTPAALASLRPALYAALAKTRGESTAGAIIEELDDLIARAGLGQGASIGATASDPPEADASDTSGARFW